MLRSAVNAGTVGTKEAYAAFDRYAQDTLAAPSRYDPPEEQQPEPTLDDLVVEI
jgi:hypothetical protein